MNVSAWCNHNARRANPRFRPVFEPDPRDTIDVPGIVVTEGEEADALIRHDADMQQRRAEGLSR